VNEEAEAAMTELDEAVADVRRQSERIARMAAALYIANRVNNVRQAELVKRYDLTRETIRRHVEDERIRRGEIPPTPRYLHEQEKRKRSRTSS
jgi:transcription initiation factor TFIIIB Brf1 subunit/transcription initiation factor TFIIB